MHCLGAVSNGSASPQRAGNCGSVLGVVRALGVLVSEGRIQGPPRGYKEGPHCAAPLQPVPKNHVCEKDNYLCDRYVILVREIADRVTTCSYLCVEVLLCTDCPCGMAKATSKDPVLPIPSMSIAPWQQSSEMLLEYWCISVVPSKGPEMMNNQSLYQAVRSRLHFSQVAAWWSRSKGAAPSYITTRVVSFSEDNLRKFREPPSEHTFPLAACGDGNSIKVTVWALPRVEDVPILNCPIHPVSEREDEGAARASTPTKNIPVPATTANSEDLVLPTLVDDRLQTPCNEPGKHHCRCEEEDGCPPSPSVRANGERKRRRSLPRGPDFIPSAIPHTSTAATSVLPSVCELAAREHENRNYLNGGLDSTGLNYNETRHPTSGPYCMNSEASLDCRVHQIRCSTLPLFSEEQSNKESLYFDNQMTTNDLENVDLGLERTFGSQLSLQEQESNVEKRYKCSIEPSSLASSGNLPCDNKPYSSRREKSQKYNKKDCQIRWERTGAIADDRPVLFGNNQRPTSEQSSSFTTASLGGHSSMVNINRTTSTISGKETESGYKKRDKVPLNVPQDTLPILHSKANLIVNPFSESSPFHESNPGPSTFIYNDKSKLQAPFDSLSGQEDKNLHLESMARNSDGDKPVQGSNEKEASVASDDLNQLMSKLKFSEETDKTKDEKGIFDWISKVPSRVFNVTTTNGLTEQKSKANDCKIEEDNNTSEVKSKQNCNLELSQREFDEVLAVLRARTPAGRRRAPFRTIKRRDKLEKQTDEWNFEQRSDFREKTASNLNGSDYTTHNNVHNRTAIANRLGIAELHNGSKDLSLAKPEKREQMKTYHRNARTVDYPYQSFQHQWYEYQDGKLGGRVANGRNNYCEKVEKPAAKPAECFYNVTNKADVLLGAILRTSKDSRKGLSDISNGARPRTVLPGENCDSKEVDRAKQVAGGVKPFEDDRLLPSSLNKRISQIKQLFKKEQDKTDWETLVSEEYGQEYNATYDRMANVAKPRVPLKNSKDSKVKRRIDFSNLSQSSHRCGDQNESLRAGAETFSSTKNSLYQNPLFNGINDKAQNTFLVEIREQSLSKNNEETNGAEGRCFISNPIKRSTNLKLKIDQRATETGCVDHEEIYNGEKHNYDQAAAQEHQNYTDFENNDTSDKGVPSVVEQERFRRSLGNAASMVFHSRTGLPLTSSPAPLRRGSCCFDYDSSLNSVSSKRSALFELNTPPSPGAVSLEEGDREAENICEGEERTKRRTASRGLPHSHALLGSFEESALNGRLEPVSTVHGFTAELGASGSFCPKHRKLPVTVFFYTLGDNDKVSTPYLAHINLGKKGYQVPRSGTIQVTLLNPLGTVVKMFVVMYDLSDMPPRSHTFLRQRTLRDKTLRYLIHLRFMSGKSGRIYLHTDIRMIICRKSDVDTASDLGAEPPKELRSFVHGPTNPKFSPRC